MARIQRDGGTIDLGPVVLTLGDICIVMKPMILEISPYLRPTSNRETQLNAIQPIQP